MLLVSIRILFFRWGRWRPQSSREGKGRGEGEGDGGGGRAKGAGFGGRAGIWKVERERGDTRDPVLEAHFIGV